MKTRCSSLLVCAVLLHLAGAESLAAATLVQGPPAPATHQPSTPPATPAPATPAGQAAPPAGAVQQPSQPQPTAPGQPQAVGTSGPWTEDYKVGPGDKLRIEVYKDAQLSQSVQVRPDGKITMPLIGDLVAADLTPLQLRDKIASALKEYVTNPVVTVIVVETLASNVFVMGEVMKAGPLPYQGQMTALQAIAMAGGFKDFANTKDIRILRRGPKGVETIRFNYNDAVKGDDPLYLRVGDTIIVR
jgi:polysaccharide biosynthesis/export protein